MHMASHDMLKLATQPMELINLAMEQPDLTLRPAENTPEPPVIRPRQDCSSFLAEVPSRHRTNTLDTGLQKNPVDKNIRNADDVFPASPLEEQISEHQFSSVHLAESQADGKRTVSPGIVLQHKAINWLDKVISEQLAMNRSEAGQVQGLRKLRDDIKAMSENELEHIVRSTVRLSELIERKHVADASPNAFLKPMDENASPPQ